MASHPNSADSKDYLLLEQLLYLYNSDPVTFLQMDLSQVIAGLSSPSLLHPTIPRDELHPVETQPSEQPANVDDVSTIPTTRSLSISLPATLPLLQPVTSPPSKLHVVPQRAYKQKQTGYKPSEPILFPVDNFPGINMGDAIRKNFTTLKGRDDLVMQGAKMAFSCRFLFVGYPDRSFQIFTKHWDKNRNPILRSKLAYEIARRLKQYLDTMMRSHAIASPVDRRWEIGEGFMHLNNMFLARLESVTKGSYQPVFYVVDPTV